jgi:hypothetical protein
MILSVAPKCACAALGWRIHALSHEELTLQEKSEVSMSGKERLCFLSKRKMIRPELRFGKAEGILDGLVAHIQAQDVFQR